MSEPELPETGPNADEVLLSSALEEAMEEPDGPEVGELRDRELHPAPAPPVLPHGLPNGSQPLTVDVQEHSGGVLEAGEEVAPAPPPGMGDQPSGHQSSDSITLGQLRGMVINQPKPKVT